MAGIIRATGAITGIPAMARVTDAVADSWVSVFRSSEKALAAFAAEDAPGAIAINPNFRNGYAAANQTLCRRLSAWPGNYG